jgi:hypothetical protein
MGGAQPLFLDNGADGNTGEEEEAGDGRRGTLGGLPEERSGRGSTTAGADGDGAEENGLETGTGNRKENGKDMAVVGFYGKR